MFEDTNFNKQRLIRERGYLDESDNSEPEYTSEQIERIEESYAGVNLNPEGARQHKLVKAFQDLLTASAPARSVKIKIDYTTDKMALDFSDDTEGLSLFEHDVNVSWLVVAGAINEFEQLTLLMKDKKVWVTDSSLEELLEAYSIMTSETDKDNLYAETKDSSTEEE